MRTTKLALALALLLGGCADVSDSSLESAADSDGVTARDLVTEIDAGRVLLVSAMGNGSSSGVAVEGTILNNTDEFVRIRIGFSRPLYLTNAGRGQNMIALQVFMRDGSYFSEGEDEFIEVGSKETVPVAFVAFCADFDRDNPSAEERFTVATMPVGLEEVAAQLLDHLRRNPDADVTVAGQLAVWISQGQSIEGIREQFDFTPEDHRLALTLIQ